MNGKSIHRSRISISKKHMRETIKITLSIKEMKKNSMDQKNHFRRL